MYAGHGLSPFSQFDRVLYGISNHSDNCLLLIPFSFRASIIVMLSHSLDFPILSCYDFIKHLGGFAGLL